MSVEVTQTPNYLEVTQQGSVIELSSEVNALEVSSASANSVEVSAGANAVEVSSGISSYTLNVPGTAGAPVSVYQVLVLMNGLLYPADVTDVNHAGLVVGIARNSALSGGYVSYTQVGKGIGTMGLTPGPLYVGAAGAMSSVPQQVGAAWWQQIGVAETANNFVVDLGTAIFK